MNFDYSEGYHTLTPRELFKKYEKYKESNGKRND